MKLPFYFRLSLVLFKSFLELVHWSYNFTCRLDAFLLDLNANLFVTLSYNLTIIFNLVLYPFLKKNHFLSSTGRTNRTVFWAKLTNKFPGLRNMP